MATFTDEQLASVRSPTPNDSVYKDEDVFSFDSPLSAGGLFVSLNNFWGFNRENALKNYEKTGQSVYLHLKKTKKPVAEEVQEPQLKKPKKMELGTVDGFAIGGGVEYEESNSIAILPDFKTIPVEDCPEKIQLAVAGIIAAQSATRKEDVAAWKEELRVTKHADLKVLDNGVKVPPGGWKCLKCDLTENLWMNLTDGTILCGRKNWDGSGGNGHALNYFDETGYPLCVKLGTICADVKKIDVFSYDEDDMVEFPRLAEVLEHWGINIKQMEATEKTLAEMEVDFNLSHEFSKILEAGKEMETVYGPERTGMINIGSSCYLNSVVQCLFSIDDFKRRFYDTAEDTFATAPSDPHNDFHVQMAKVAKGLCSGRYSKRDEERAEDDHSDNGIAPRMFKSIVGRGHEEFSTMKQQDAMEYYQHLMNFIERQEKRVRSDADPSKIFRYEVEERVQCTSSQKVRYGSRTDNIFSLPVPISAAAREKGEREYMERKEAAEKAGETYKGEPVQFEVSFKECLDNFASPEEVKNWFSTAINANTTAVKTTRFKTFPKYLVVHLQKFTINDDWTPAKLNAAVMVPEEIDLESLRGSGLKPGEEELPAGEGAAAAEPEVDRAVVAQLVDMGFPETACHKAVVKTGNQGVEAASQWIFAHMEDSDFADPLPPAGGAAASGGAEVDADGLMMLVSMGIDEAKAKRAMKACSNNVERAVDWAFSHGDEPEEGEEVGAGPAPLDDGPGKYQLKAFISHMGKSAHCGHYVCHIKKDGQWLLYNDEKVAVSTSPPFDMGYMYIFERK